MCVSLAGGSWNVINKSQSMGPSTVPCGTPDVTRAYSEVSPSTKTLLPDRKEIPDPDV
jgi:hypothetical protein